MLHVEQTVVIGMAESVYFHSNTKTKSIINVQQLKNQNRGVPLKQVKEIMSLENGDIVTQTVIFNI